MPYKVTKSDSDGMIAVWMDDNRNQNHMAPFKNVISHS